MPEKKSKTKEHASKSGIIKRPILEPKVLYEPPPPPSTLPEMRDEGATTGAMPVVSEGEDDSAERDDDNG